MARGTVAPSSNNLGYWFIRSESGGPDVFCHWSAVIADGYKKLSPGDVVEYDVENGRKGIEARNVRKVGP